MAEYVLEMRDITKRFPDAVALDNASFALRPGEVHGLAGGNGAGKSTLMKILAGAEPMDAGEILIEDYPALITSPLDALDLGISMVPQKSHLVPRLSVAENIFLGRAPRRGRRGMISWRQTHEEARALLDRVGMDLDPRRPAGELGAARQKLVEIAKALSIDARVIVMDEPAATLTGRERNDLFTLVTLLRRRGIGIIYVSRQLEDILAVAQRVTVMRDGRHIATHDTHSVKRGDLIHMMTGSGVSEERPE